jgi:hypothetical protein
MNNPASISKEMIPSAVFQVALGRLEAFVAIDTRAWFQAIEVFFESLLDGW